MGLQAFIRTQSGARRSRGRISAHDVNDIAAAEEGRGNVAGKVASEQDPKGEGQKSLQGL